MEYRLRRTTFPLNRFSTDRTVSGERPDSLEVDMMLGGKARRPSMPPRTILRAPGPLGSSPAKPAFSPRLLARTSRHAEDELASSRALPFSPRRGTNEEGVHSSLREAVCGPSLLLLALSTLSNAPKDREHHAMPLSVVTATPACVHVRLCLTGDQLTPGPLELAIEIENCASHPVALSFGSNQNFDFSATRPGETVPTWRWASGRRFPPLLRAQRLDSGSILRFEAQWPDAPAGVWCIDGKFTANGGFDAARVEVEIG